MRPKPGTKQFEYDFRTVTEADLERERIVERYVAEHLADWQARRLGAGDANRSRVDHHDTKAATLSGHAVGPTGNTSLTPDSCSWEG